MNKNIISGGCSFTFGHELSDYKDSKTASTKTWAHGLSNLVEGNHFSTAKGGLGNSGIARRVFNYVSNNPTDFVLVMWTFSSRYDWAMPHNSYLEGGRWVSITPWDTKINVEQVNACAEPEQEIWRKRRTSLSTTGVTPLADTIFKHASNQYHEIYLSWKSIIWLQNILEKKKIPYLFTLADNSLFYQDKTPHSDIDGLLKAMYNEIDFGNWHFFGERKMGFNQWAMLNDYQRGTTHPLDKAHKDAIMLMKDNFMRIYKKEIK